MRNGQDRRSENPQWVTRIKSARKCLGPISGSHQGRRSKRPHSQAGYMTAPERFAESRIPLALRAPLNNELQSSGLQLSFPWNCRRRATTEQAISRAVRLHDNKNRLGESLGKAATPAGRDFDSARRVVLLLMSRFVSVTFNFNPRKKSRTPVVRRPC
jgi:hypothetical protein